MEFFATGAFSSSTASWMTSAESLSPVSSDLILTASSDLDYGYAEARGQCDQVPVVDTEYYGIITLDSNNNQSNDYTVGHPEDEDHGLFFDFSDQDLSGCSTAGCSPPELSEWEQRLLDNFVEIPELIDFLPERTPLCTDMCDDFLEESNSNLRLAAPPPPPPAPPVSPSCLEPAPTAPATDAATDAATDTATVPQLSQNAAGERGYLCTFGNCEKLYAKPAHLKAHLRRHLGEKPYACSWPECSWRFSRSDELARHRRSHSGVKPYKCDYCAKCFARSDHLTKHRKVHERRLLAATRLGKLLPDDVYAVRPGRKRKNQL
ncbi:GL13099 [Drosophila persimilis]|uniref:GL13099 n=1 Tax=Drosophila persimilis TaxID=7234 RepID=B4GV55_DROPE|nr:GL13099 [Drosophila persimilis]